MSFGGAIRFQVAPNQDKPSIYWHKDAAQKKSRKFGYKNKELRHPIRRPVEEPEPEAKAPELERQKNKTDFIKRNRDRAKGKEAEKKEHPAANTVTLTQDQLNAILASVGGLSSGKENGLRISIDPDSKEIQIDKAAQVSKDREGQSHEKRKAKQEGQGDSKNGPDVSIYSLVNGQLVRENTKTAADLTQNIVREPPLETSKEEPKVTEKSKTARLSEGAVPLTSQAPSTLTSPRRGDGLPFVVSKHMTVAEKKRLQWAREKAEMAATERDYDPWGRPGAGAPLRGADGNILTDYNSRKEEVVRKSHEDAVQRGLQNARQKQAVQATLGGAMPPDRPPLPERNAPLPTTDPQPAPSNFMFGGNQGINRKATDKEEEKRRWVEELDKQREEKRLQKMKEKEWLRGGSDARPPPTVPLMQQQQQQQQQQQFQQQQQQRSTGQTKETPAAMRSSFVIGQLAPNEKRFDNSKAEEKKRWLAELEKQMEEKRLKKLSEKQKELGQVQDTWADRLSYPEPKQEAGLPITALTSNLSPRVPVAMEKEDVYRVNSAPLTASQTLDAEENMSHIRGQNVYIDPVTKQELNDKRQRHLELQDALKAQIEEKKRLKDQERENARLEEMAEEQRLKAEQARIQLQYQQDQQKLRQKEEQRQSKIDELKSKMDEAQEAASQERMLRRLKVLKDGGHDVSQLQAHYDALSPRTRVVAPTYVPGLSPRDLGSSSAPQHHRGPYVHAGVTSLQDSVEHQPYVENRILTPSQYRNPSLPCTDPSSPKREFGTQTTVLRRPSSGVEIEYHPRPGDEEEGARAGRRAVEGVRTRKTTKAAAAREPPRTKSEPGRRPRPERAKEAAKPKGPQVWNYSNQKHKKPVKQSERDPHFEQRKHEREERRAQREQQLLALVEANKHTIPREKHQGSHGHRAADGQAGPGPRAGGHRGDGDDRESAAGVSRRTSYHDHVPHILPPAIRELSEPELNLHPNQARSPAPHPSHHQQQGSSLPVPAARHRGESHFDDGDSRANMHRPGPPVSRTGRSGLTHYDDLDPVLAPDGTFVPFMRTSEVLDPARAAEPLQVSRENTRVLNARNAYLGSRNPGNYGQTLTMYDDPPSQNSRSKDPILNPDLVKGHPTARQDAILAQLSTLKQSLIQRQREIETYMDPPALEPQ